ncbi:hypothetical protein QUF72_04395 [Desulfobacterales bacterium HSG2]|nr:hypothetical protein [Desulfobacterales bacterium HSG2]
MLSFNECTLEMLDSTFGLKQIRTSQSLQNLLDGEAELSDLEHNILLNFRELLLINVDNWNEQELALNFIGPVFALINFTGENFNLFADRLLKGVVDGIEMKGKPDSMIASGWRVPKKPYFCFQEYKKEKDAEGDPAAQALAAMLVSQEINEHKIPVYGCYVRGRFWFFMVLKDKSYCISDAYTATKDDLFDIFRILKVLKQFVMEIAEQN